MLSEIENHLKETIEVIDSNTMEVPINEFDGKIVYGEKRLAKKSTIIKK